MLFFIFAGACDRRPSRGRLGRDPDHDVVPASLAREARDLQGEHGDAEPGHGRVRRLRQQVYAGTLGLHRHQHSIRSQTRYVFSII